MDIIHDLNTLERITGINNEVLAGMIEEGRITGEITAGEYHISKEAFIKWADNIIDQL